MQCPRFKRRLLLWLVCTTFVVSAASCAYFNLFYNAKKEYKEAQKAPRTADGGVNRPTLDIYDRVIEKCQMLITNYPDSKHVDDAVLLMGKAFYEKGEYDLAITKFEELQSNFPASELNEEGQLYLAKSHVAEEARTEAVGILKALVQARPNSRFSDEILFLLGTSSIHVGNESEAVQYLELLAKKHPQTEFRLDADLEMADLYAEREEYDKALVIYEKLSDVKLSDENSIRYLEKFAVVYVRMGDYAAALKVLDRLRRFVLGDEIMASEMLLESEAYAGMDSLAKAIDTYGSVSARFPRSKFSAEAHYRMGLIYQERLDSLDLARSNYDEVPAQYANSPYAEDAVRRSVSINRLQQLKASLGEGGAASKAEVKFELAETELFQLNNYEKALINYEQVLDQFPTSDVAPRAAYAIAYIYEKILDDQEKARQAYQRLVRDYPESQQAMFARQYLGESPSDELEETRSD